MLKKVLQSILPIAIFSLFSFLAAGQNLDHVQGEIMVKLWPQADTHVRHWVKSKRSLNGVETAAEYKKKISDPMDIHAITFDYTAVDEEEFLQSILRDPLVQAAQFDHFVTLRSTIPDDPQFADQWQYINTGQSGGLTGADIDMDLAWDITTGGITPDGDTIVACIIDGGVDLDHPDLVDNLWVNHAEIPDNGIDDDGNGFIDDYQGWSTAGNNDNVGNNAGHGTPVTGIIGAKGNNGIGVAGVNWNVKLMFVQGGTGVESEVLEAYSYPLIARQRYNATDGEEGAFVVSTNASWGIDQGQPANAPLWCAFYDTLGVHGILNCGATANANFNIDVVGDLPTACSSEYMIAVTNMNDEDVKVTGAGYGTETIDLGAFGQGTWTAAANAGYGGFGGTSGATPHVTGAIALMYSAPCPALISLAKSDPGAAAILVRDYIFEGTDANTSLDGITTTGGRLNVFNALSLLMANCGPCPPPTGLALSDLTDTEVNVNWNSNDSTLNNSLRWRVAGAADWNEIENATSPYALDGLMACTEYELDIVGYCAEDTSYSAPVFFQTDGCCENPSEFAALSIDDSSGSVSWSSVLAALSYNVRISEAGTGTWADINTTDLSATFVNLLPCTEYEVQIQVVCDGNMVEYSESATFRTKGCGPCTDLEYCEMSDEVDVSEEFIAEVSIGDLQNASDADGSYTSFTDDGPTATFTTFGTYDVTLTPGYPGGQAFNEQFRVYVDLNQDGNFSANEMLFDSGAPAAGPASGSLTIPGDATLGFTRLRVVMAWNNAPTSCDFNSEYGESEDYCVTIVEGTPPPAPCDIPDGLMVNNITTTSADLDWDSADGATEYVVRHKKTADTDWTEANSSNNTFAFAGLEPDTEYEAQVKSICPDAIGMESAYSESEIFTTEMVSAVRVLEGLQNWNVFPNPFSQTLTVNFAFANPQAEIQIELLDQLGRSVRQQVLENVPVGQQQIRMDASNFSEGIYFIRISDVGGNSMSKKTMKLGF